MKRWIVCLVIICGLLSGMLLHVYANLNEQKQIIKAATTEKQVWKGEYTIFQYTQNGWSNHMYVTEFYKEDGYLFYKLKDHQEEYMFIKAEEFLPVPGWIESTDELMKYGFWEPMESDW